MTLETRLADALRRMKLEDSQLRQIQRLKAEFNVNHQPDAFFDGVKEVLKERYIDFNYELRITSHARDREDYIRAVRSPDFIHPLIDYLEKQDADLESILTNKEIIDDIECPICTQPNLIPHVILHENPCLRPICFRCINYIRELDGDFARGIKACPFDRSTFRMMDVKRLHSQERIIGSLSCICWREGCGKAFSIEEALTHFISECEFEIVYCPSQECYKKMEKRAEIKKHLLLCPNRETLCRCGVFFEPSSYITHLEAECPLNLVCCKYERFGCTAKYPKLRLELHYQEDCDYEKVSKILLEQEKEIARLKLGSTPEEKDPTNPKFDSESKEEDKNPLKRPLSECVGSKRRIVKD
jgi:hypothetical protein